MAWYVQGPPERGPNPRLLAQLGLALHALGHHPEAERAYLDGLALAPTDVVLLCRYALLCLSVGQLDKADKLLASAATENPYAPIVYATRIELAYARGHDREAERFSRDFLAEYPQRPLALAMHGRSAALRGRIALAYGRGPGMWPGGGAHHLPGGGVMFDLDPALARAAALLDVDRPAQALAELARLPMALATDPTAFQLRAEALIALDRCASRRIRCWRRCARCTGWVRSRAG